VEEGGGWQSEGFCEARKDCAGATGSGNDGQCERKKSARIHSRCSEGGGESSQLTKEPERFAVKNRVSKSAGEVEFENDLVSEGHSNPSSANSGMLDRERG